MIMDTKSKTSKPSWRPSMSTLAVSALAALS